MKVCDLSPTLQDLLGVKQMARNEVVKAMWALVRERDLLVSYLVIV